MIVTVKPSTIQGSLKAPRSKSSMQRACAAALLSKGNTIIKNPGFSNDDKAALDVIQQLGANIKYHGDHLNITSNGIKPISSVIDCGESGLGIRMFAPIVALSEEQIIVKGRGSALNRPMEFFDEVFPKLGINFQSNNGKLPLKIKGPLVPCNIEVDGSLSSQFLTGLLMAYAASGASDVTIKVNNLNSKPYIDLTLQVMKLFGIEVSNHYYQSFYFPKDSNGFKPQTYNVEGDWSGSAFLLVAGAIAGSISVEDLDLFSTQADKKIMDALKNCQAKLSLHPRHIEIGPSELKSFELDATDCPDLFPPLVTLASYCKGSTRLNGVRRLLHKESNRAMTLQQEFAKMGVSISLMDDVMVIKGGGGVTGATVHSHHDHRIAMACAIAALKAKGPVIIEAADAISKSYPAFFTDIEKLGVEIDIRQSAISSS